MKNKKKITFFCIILVLFFGCRKYPNEPSIKRYRLIGNHYLRNYSLNSIDKTDSIRVEKYFLKIEKSGKYTIQGAFPDEGTWSFSNDKNEILFRSSTSSSEKCYELLFLNNRTIKVRRILSGGQLEIYEWGEYPVIA